MAKLLEVVIMPGIKESLKDFSSQDHILTEVCGGTVSLAVMSRYFSAGETC